MKVMTVDEQQQLRYKMFLLGTSCLARKAWLSKCVSLQATFVPTEHSPHTQTF